MRPTRRAVVIPQHLTPVTSPQLSRPLHVQGVDFVDAVFLKSKGGAKVPTLVVGMYAPFGIVGGDALHDLHWGGRLS